METDITDEVQTLLIRTTPEKSDLIRNLMKGVTIYEDDVDEQIGFEVTPRKRFIRSTQRFQLRLWVHGFAYFSAFSYASRKAFDQQNLSFTLSETDLEITGKLLEWAVDVDASIVQELRQGKKIETYPLPRTLTLFSENSSREIPLDMPDELFRNALAFIYFHELAHIHFQHKSSTPEEKIASEHQADQAAAKWLLGGGNPEGSSHLYRHFGAATVLVFLTSILLRHRYIPYGHPPDWDRILPVLEPSVNREDDPVWGYVAIALFLHTHRQGVCLGNLSELGPNKKTVCAMIASIKKHNDRLEQPKCP